MTRKNLVGILSGRVRVPVRARNKFFLEIKDKEREIWSARNIFD